MRAEGTMLIAVTIGQQNEANYFINTNKATLIGSQLTVLFPFY